ncbi:MAG: hypothetical protein ACRCY9_14470 [Phycicoccus sp.]
MFAGCGTAQDRPVVTARAEIDERTGVIALPADKYWYSAEEDDEIASALRAAMILCKRELGAPHSDEFRRVIPDEVDNRQFGLWRLSQAEKFGYVRPASPAKRKAIEGKGKSEEPSEAELTAGDKCVKTDERLKRLNKGIQDGPWLREFGDAEIEAEESDEWQGAVSDWISCLAGQGITVKPGDVVPQGVDWDAVDAYDVRPDDVRLAVADVQCKQKVNYVQRQADLFAAGQAPVVEKYYDELNAQRADIEAQVAYAREVLRDAGL